MLKFDDIAPPSGPTDRGFQDISDSEIVELASAFRHFGLWRSDLESGHVYMSEGACAIYGIPFGTGPINIAEVAKAFHPADRDIAFAAIEQAVRLGQGGHFIYRVADGEGHYRPVRMVMKMRQHPEIGPQVIGIVYQMFDQFSSADMMDVDPELVALLEAEQAKAGLA